MQSNNMMKNNNFAPLTISILAAVVILSAALVVLPIQQASAQSTSRVRALPSSKDNRTHVVALQVVVIVVRLHLLPLGHHHLLA
jgi:hypothetical protein